MTSTDTQPAPMHLGDLAAALAKFQAEMPTVLKSHTANVKSDKGAYSYTYAGLADVSEAVMPLLAKHGLAFSTLPGGGVLTGMLLHESGQYLTAALPVTGGTPQAIGSSLTYGRRYLLGCMTGIVTDDDDDGQAAQTTPRKASKPAATEQTARASSTAEVTDAQVKKILVQLKDLGVTDNAGRYEFLTDTLGRTITSSKELTKAEGSRVIEKLTELLTPAGELLPPPPEPDGWNDRG